MLRFKNRLQRQNFRDACEDALLKLAEDGDKTVEKIVDNPWLMRRVLFRMARDKHLTENMGSDLLDQFERLVLFLLEHADAILAVILKVIPLFVQEPEGDK